MKYLLDTNVVIALLKDTESPTALRARQHQPADMAISAVLAYELSCGAFKSQRQVHNLARVDALQFEVVPFDQEDARAAGEMRANLAARGTPIGPYDVLIAGQALVRGLVLVTRNLGEFRRVTGLKVEDWEG